MDLPPAVHLWLPDRAINEPYADDVAVGLVVCDDIDARRSRIGAFGLWLEVSKDSHCTHHTLRLCNSQWSVQRGQHRLDTRLLCTGLKSFHLSTLCHVQDELDAVVKEM